MKHSKRISVLLILLLLLGMFAQVPFFSPVKVSAGVKLQEENQDDSTPISVIEQPGKLIISNGATGGGLNTGGITNVSYLFTPTKISGDFSVEAKIKISGYSLAKSGGVVGVGAFEGTNAMDTLVVAVARGDDTYRSYYKKTATTFGAGSPNVPNTTIEDKTVIVKVERSNGDYNISINDSSNKVSASSIANGTAISDMYLGLVICGAIAEVDKLIIKQGTTILYDLDATTPSEGGTPPIPISIDAVQNGNNIDITWDGEELTETTSYLLAASKDSGDYNISVTDYTYSNYQANNSFSYTYKPNASGSYRFQVKGKAGDNLSTAVTTTTAINYLLPLAKPTLTVAQDKGVISLKWAQVPEAERYSVTVLDEEGNELPDLSKENLSAIEDHYSKLVDGAKYAFYVTAYRGAETISSDTSALITYSADYIPTEPEWRFRVFGSSTNLTDNSYVKNDDGSITLTSLNEKGKISSSTDGIAYYYTPWDSTKPFELTAKVRIDAYEMGNNQRAFGLMLRDTVGIHGDDGGHTSNYVAAGSVYQGMEAFYKNLITYPNTIKRTTFFAFGKDSPVGKTYTLRLIKNEGNTAIVSVDGNTAVIDTTGMFPNDRFYIGLFTARKATVTFSDIELLTNVSAIKINNPPTKTQYLVGEELNLSGLSVSAEFDGAPTTALSASDYIISGYDKNTVGTQTVHVNYGGRSASFTVEVIQLTCEQIEIEYLPAKTTYYFGDSLDTSGMVIQATFNSGLIRPLTEEEYTITGFDSSTAGEKQIVITLNENAAITASFTIKVLPARLQAVEIRNKPAKTVYFIGEEWDAGGMVVYAKYSDNSQIRLAKGDYTVSELDTSTAGPKVITITYKDKTATVSLVVKEKEVVGIEVTNYPKTTYVIGEAFESTGLEISKVYDNGDREVLAASAYTINSSAFDSAKKGTYTITVRPADASLASIAYTVTVREAVKIEWKSIRFGQSSSDARNKIEPVDENTVRLTALEGGGKVTGDHDGISFYYTEIDAAKDNFVLSADIKVIEYAKSPHDGQESFGLMARDAIGTAGDASIFASNIAAIGGFSGGTGNANGTQLFIRTGVTSPDGAGSKGIQRIMLQNVKPTLENTYPAAPYRLTLAKTNSGYTGKLNNGKEEIFFEPEILNVQNSKIYVGFYTARLATIEVSNIEFTVTDAVSDAPKVEPPAQSVTPALQVLSLDKVSTTDYNLLLQANVNGSITVKKGTEMVAQDVAVAAQTLFTLPTKVADNAATNFSITFLPDDTQYLSSYDKIIKNFTVTMKTLGNGRDIYVSPTGTSTGTGSEADPLDLDTAITYVKPGQKIIVLDGTYARTSGIHIKKYNDGTAEAMKYLVAAPGAKPVFDFGQKSEGVVLSGNYWHVRGIDFTRTGGNQKPFTVGGSHNIVELCRFYGNGETGLQISRTDNANDISKWPSYNLILNCTSFDNRDPSDNNADGFAAKLTSGVGNVFRGCVAHNNIDDGWDLYTKAGSGAIGVVIIENCIAYNNGTLTDGTVGKGDKNGFKLGGEGIHVPHIIRNSIAYGNGAVGFTSNSNPGVIAENNIAWNNNRNLVFTTYTGITPDFKLKGFISVQGKERDNYGTVLDSEYNYMFNGSKTVNKTGVEITTQKFESLAAPVPIVRDNNGNIVWGNFWSKFQAMTTPQQSNDDDDDSSPSTPTPTVSPSPTPTPQPVVSATGEATIHPKAGGTVSVGDVVSVVIPKGALTGESNVQVSIQKVVTPPAVEKGQQIVGQVYEFSVDNSNSYQFKEKIVLTFKIDPSMLKPGVKLSVHYYDEKNNKWVEIGGSIRDDIITIEVDHFTKFAVIATVQPPAFSDIAGHWAEDSITELAKMGVIHGLPDGTFQPERVVTRAEMAKMLVEAFKLSAQQGKVFDDTKYHWAKDYVATAAFHKVVNGYSSSKFGPNDSITREQAAVMLVNITKLSPDAEAIPFADSKDISSWAEKAVFTAVKKEIIPLPEGNTLKPKQFITRAEAATYIINALRLK